MSDDLIERLHARPYRKGHETEAEAQERRHNDRTEAADRIAALEAQVAALTASPAPDPAANALGEVRQAMTAYHLALDRRQHGGVAAGAFVDAVSDILDMPWRQGAALAALPKGGA